MCCVPVAQDFRVPAAQGFRVPAAQGFEMPEKALICVPVAQSFEMREKTSRACSMQSFVCLNRHPVPAICRALWLSTFT